MPLGEAIANFFEAMAEPAPEKPALEGPKLPSKYNIVELPDGFTIWRNPNPLQPELPSMENVISLTVQYRDTYWHVGDSYQVGIYMWRELVKQIGSWFTDRVLSSKSSGTRAWKDAREYIIRALSYRVYEQWQRVIKSGGVPENVAKLARLMWSSTQQDASILHCPSLYTDEYKFVYRDLVKYHACRMFAKAMIKENLPEKDGCDYMANWRLHLCGEQPSKALNKTIDKVPAAVSFHDITALARLQIDRPITGRLALIFTLKAVQHYGWRLHQRAVLNADERAIREAIAVSGYNLPRTPRSADINTCVSYILDYPEAYHGGLVGLAQRSHDWHHDIYNRRRNDYRALIAAEEIPPDKELPAPPVDTGYLEGYGVKFLAKAGDLYAEGQRMQHCVGSYVEKALEGECYLFHVDYQHQGKEYQATVEVGPQGNVYQAKGPYNEHNPACEYGSRMLREAFKEAKQ